MRSFEVKVNRKARRAAFRGALATTPRTARSPFVDGVAFDAPSTKQARELLAEWGKDAPTARRRHRGRGGADQVVPQPADRVLVTVPDELEVASVVWARSLLVTEAALPLVQGRAA